MGSNCQISPKPAWAQKARKSAVGGEADKDSFEQDFGHDPSGTLALTAAWRRAAREMPRWVGPWTSIAVAAVRSGQQQEAEAAVKQVLALSPSYSIALRTANSLFRDEWVNDIFVQGLRAAGLPEG